MDFLLLCFTNIFIGINSFHLYDSLWVDMNNLKYTLCLARTLLLLQIQDFLKFVSQIYTNLPSHLNKIFEPRSQTKVKDIAEINVDALLQETYTMTTIMTDKRNTDNQSVSVSKHIQSNTCNMLYAESCSFK